MYCGDNGGRRITLRTRKEDVAMLNFILWLIVGGFVGWMASLLMGTDARQGTLLNIIVGVVGAFVAGLVLFPLFRDWHHQ